ncbi:MAG: ferrous iron transport protein A [Spirochaetes bacterium]|nr:ferrous iron transport protein A [Spirochaetota bacterium]
MNTLDSLNNGEQAIIHKFSGGKSFINRVAAMGFTLEAEVTMISKRGRGPVIVYIRDSEVALGRSEAEKIIIKENLK